MQCNLNRICVDESHSCHRIQIFSLAAVRPFVVAVVVLVAASLQMQWSWTENIPNAKDADARHSGESLRIIMRTRRIWLLGAIQSLFESAMYIFVFLWTPTLDEQEHPSQAQEHPPLGIIFASFMLAIMLGSALFRRALGRGWVVTRFLRQSLGVGAIALTVACVSSSVSLLLTAFVVYEVSCGMYFPALGTLRSELVPAAHRAAILVRPPPPPPPCCSLLR